jgi:hypothetical protein
MSHSFSVQLEESEQLAAVECIAHIAYQYRKPGNTLKSYELFKEVSIFDNKAKHYKMQFTIIEYIAHQIHAFSL